MPRREVRIAPRHLDCLVPHQVLEREDVYPLHRETACEGVPQVVPPEAFYPCAVERGEEHAVVEVLCIDGTRTGSVRKHPLALKPRREIAEDRAQIVAHRNVIVRTTLWIARGHDSRLEVDIRPGETENISPAEAGVQCHEHLR